MSFSAKKKSIGDDEIDEAAQHFTVSPLLVRTTLVNKGILERDSLSDVSESLS